ncbi:MAG: peptide chain release factor N(5)-glutamine methyltransferase [Candidatus Bipolaricaulia bacterium]
MRNEWTIRKVLNWAKEDFKRAGIIQSRFEAEVLLAHSLDVERLHLYLHPDQPLDRNVLSRYRKLIEARRQGIPIQHLTGRVDFMGLTLQIDNRALIPRPETEELIEQVIEDLGSRGDRGDLRILDLGTGTGAIAISLARVLPDAFICAVDISAAALDLARENAARNEVVDRIAFLRSNWVSGLSGRFDCIVSNPPYIDAEELGELEAELRYEPHIALDGGEGGLDALRTIIREAPDHLNDGGGLYLEIGERQGEAVKQIILETGDFEPPEVLKDLSGKDRIVRARRRSELISRAGDGDERLL